MISAVLVLDNVRDVDRVVSELAADVQVVSAHPDRYYGRDSSLNLDSPKPDRVFVILTCRYRYPIENRRPVVDVCQAIWALEPTATVHYIADPDWVGDLTTTEVLEGGHLLTPEVVAALAQ
jgi:hypothetical protein